MDRHEPALDRDLAHALRRLADDAVVPAPDPAREAALMAAFDAAGRRPPASRGRQYWAMAGLATAAALLMAVGLTPAWTGRHGIPPDGNGLSHRPPVDRRGARPDPQPPSEFVMLPGASTLPPFESGSLVRMDVAVSELPSLGVTPPAGRSNTVKADFIVGQDGLARAVRLVME